MWKQFWNWVKAGRVWRCIPEKAYIPVNGPLKAILVRAQKENRRAVESLSLLREHLSNHEKNIGRNTKGKGHSDEVSDGNEEHIIGK